MTVFHRHKSPQGVSCSCTVLATESNSVSSNVLTWKWTSNQPDWLKLCNFKFCLVSCSLFVSLPGRDQLPTQQTVLAVGFWLPCSCARLGCLRHKPDGSCTRMTDRVGKGQGSLSVIKMSRSKSNQAVSICRFQTVCFDPVSKRSTLYQRAPLFCVAPDTPVHP